MHSSADGNRENIRLLSTITTHPIIAKKYTVRNLRLLSYSRRWSAPHSLLPGVHSKATTQSAGKFRPRDPHHILEIPFNLLHYTSLVAGLSVLCFCLTTKEQEQ